jgi:hypothetical protein
MSFFASRSSKPTVFDRDTSSAFAVSAIFSASMRAATASLSFASNVASLVVPVALPELVASIGLAPLLDRA